ncbi:MAG: AbiV family abortive infection protein [Planctomycetota bacterium]|jgi:AbiV family abortive infection protein
MNQTILNSAKRCRENIRWLLDEAELLEYAERPPMRHYLSMIAQEEAAKALLLHLVAVNAPSWTPFLLRATRDHQCKQLVGIILDHMAPNTDEFLRLVNASVLDGRAVTYRELTTGVIERIRCRSFVRR